MDILDFAMKMEMDGKRFYLDAAEKAPNQELKDVLVYLAEEEQRHFNIFKNLKDGNNEAANKEFEAGNLKKTKNVFVKMIEDNKENQFGDDARAVWTEALEIEEKAVKMYGEEAAKESDPDRKKLIEKITAEEQTHVYLCDNMLSFMADPQGFVKSQDFASFKSTEGR